VVCVLGCVPFGAVYIEVYFIMSSVWEHQFYYMFGILALVFFVLIIVCAEVSIFYVYHCLANENYHWWWRAFMVSGSSAFFLMAYAIQFYSSLGMTRFVSSLLFFGYMGLAALAFFLLTGTIGFMATLVFVRKIYATIKID
jgi:transmembrane 9 superfamily protein 2/4